MRGDRHRRRAAGQPMPNAVDLDARFARVRGDAASLSEQADCARLVPDRTASTGVVGGRACRENRRDPSVAASFSDGARAQFAMSANRFQKMPARHCATMRSTSADRRAAPDIVALVAGGKADRTSTPYGSRSAVPAPRNRRPSSATRGWWRRRPQGAAARCGSSRTPSSGSARSGQGYRRASDERGAARLMRQRSAWVG